jgi:hypothetical protein
MMLPSSQRSARRGTGEDSPRPLLCWGHNAAVRTRPSLIAAVAREVFALPHRAARGLVLRDLDSWLRLQFLGVVGPGQSVAAPENRG